MDIIKQKRLLYMALFLLACSPLRSSAQTWALKTNLVTDVLLIPTLGVEYALSDRHSISLQGTYTPFTVGDRKWKNWSVQPELRLWKEAPLMGPYLGINVIGGGFNIDNVRIGGLYGKHRQGYMMGTGLSLGYHKMLSTHWNLEFSVGGSALLCTYEKYRDGKPDGYRRSGVLLPIGTGISLVYIID